MIRVEIRSGTKTSFWYDEWSQLGRIIDIIGTRGCIDLGIPITVTVEFAVQRYRSHHHRVAHMIDIENEIMKLRLQGLTLDIDIQLWKEVGDSFKTQDCRRHELTGLKPFGSEEQHRYIMFP